MVLENLFAGVVNQFLGNYIENVTSRDMSFGLDGMTFNTAEIRSVFIVKSPTIVVLSAYLQLE